ncbi:hypothetical protein BWI15_28520 [Kribbella sp. ALI-6-A]|uniref:hypothetical protein n=1 Tax=Kribbella sp. ALI-6-A TaxID=1933817 RepID=UPI00097CA7EC|nr:hypothetical protein [Kribbella sp. ALI-6-A]ONI67115.1 hypothetical protein BWI15_28520 [Kribbella sp. ALI-6-A]
MTVHGREVLTSFTDEELAAIAGPDQEVVAPMPWLDQQPVEQRELTLSVALRGLVARGVVEQVDHDRETDSLVLSLSAQTQALLTMRHTVSAVVIAERQTARGKHAIVQYFGDGVLEEDVDQSGLHTFSVCSDQHALDGLVELCDPADVAGDHTGEAEVLTDHAVPASLDDAVAVTVFAGVTQGPYGEPRQERLAVYAFADHVLLAHRPLHATDLVLRRVSSQSLRRAIGALTGRGQPDRW